MVIEVTRFKGTSAYGDEEWGYTYEDEIEIDENGFYETMVNLYKFNNGDIVYDVIDTLYAVLNYKQLDDMVSEGETLKDIVNYTMLSLIEEGKKLTVKNMLIKLLSEDCCMLTSDFECCSDIIDEIKRSI